MNISNSIGYFTSLIGCSDQGLWLIFRQQYVEIQTKRTQLISYTHIVFHNLPKKLLKVLKDCKEITVYIFYNFTYRALVIAISEYYIQAICVSVKLSVSNIIHKLTNYYCSPASLLMHGWKFFPAVTIKSKTFY